VPEDTPVHVALYKDLKNASFLRQQLISGNADFQYAFIDASVVGLNSYHIYEYIYIYIYIYMYVYNADGSRFSRGSMS
jgi:EKC/KEOPS complex subunit CGI121/TPRKB